MRTSTSWSTTRAHSTAWKHARVRATSSAVSRCVDAHLGALDVDGMPAQRHHGELRRAARPRRGLLEEQGGAASGEHLRHLGDGQRRQGEHVVELVARQVVDVEEVPGHGHDAVAILGDGRGHVGQRAPRQPSPSSISSSLTSSEGASRMVSGRGRVHHQPPRQRRGHHVLGPFVRRGPHRAGAPPPGRRSTPSSPSSPARNRAPARRARAGTSSASMTASVARAAAAASGWPPKVLPWSPGREGRRHLGARPARADGHAVAECLGHRHHVGLDARVLEGEPPARAPEPGLDLVHHEQDPALGAQLAHPAQVVRGRRDHPRLALDGLERAPPPPASGRSAASSAARSS